jgi:hypothetical protein
METHEKRLEIQKALASSEDDLLAVIGFTLAQTHMHAAPPDKSRMIQLGKEWMDKNLDSIQEKICRDDNLKKFAQSDENLADLGVLIFDAIAGLYVGVPFVAISAWITKRGLAYVCHDIWSNTKVD